MASQRPVRLDSWKEIATYLGRDVSTVIRWEKEKGLPIHRLPGGKRQAVFALQQEIDSWLIGQPLDNPPDARRLPASDGMVDGQQVGAVAPPVTAPAGASNRLRSFVFGVAALGVLAAGLTFAFVRGPKARLSSIAILPLTYQGPASEPDQEYLVDGMTSALITELAKIRDLTVISETSASQFKGTSKPLAEVGRELNVDVIVRGSVSREGNLVRVNVQLIRADTDAYIWAETYQREVGSILFLQSDLALAIARELRARLTPEEQARIAVRRQVHPESYRLYLLGRYHWNKRAPEGFDKATEFFQQAIAMDPGNAPAYAGLASNYLVQASWGTLPPQEAFPMAKEAAEKALVLDSSLAEPYATLASVLSDYENDWVGAERAFRRALDLNPNNATTRQWYGLFLSALGRHNEAIEQVRRAGELDPLSPIISSSLGMVLYVARRNEEAIQQCLATEVKHPGFSTNLQVLGLLYATVGRNSEALATLDKVQGITKVNNEYGTMGWAYAAAGQKPKARDMLTRGLQAAGKQPVDFGALALIYIGLGQNDHALTWLEKSHRQRGSYTNLYLKVGPMFDPLRAQPRFQELLRLMNFPS